MPPVVRTRGRDRAEAGNDMDSSAAGHPAPGRGESDLSSSLESFGSEPAAAAASPGGKQLHNLRRQQARTKRAVESSATTNTSTSDEEWSPTGSGGRKKKAQTKKRGGARKGGGGGKAKKARRAAPVDSSADVEDFMGSDGMLVISRPHDHDVLSGRGGGINAHPGNQRFRDWVLERKESYTLGKDKGDKARVCQEVYDLIVSQDPPGRFLMREGGDKMKGRSGGPSLNSASISGGQSKWVEIPTSRAMAKISQALREGAPSIREAAKKEQKPKVSSRGRTPKRKMVSKVSSVSEVAASSGAGRGRKKKKAPTEKPPRTPKKSESDRKEDREMKPVASTNEPPARSSCCSQPGVPRSQVGSRARPHRRARDDDGSIFRLQGRTRKISFGCSSPAEQPDFSCRNNDPRRNSCGGGTLSPWNPRWIADRARQGNNHATTSDLHDCTRSSSNRVR